jgi:uncharacterized protein (DUF169 family)
VGIWAERADEITRQLRLRTSPVAYRRLEKADDLDGINRVSRLSHLSTLCQALFMVRVQGRTIGITKTDKLWDRCMRIHGLKSATEESMREESAVMGKTWFGSTAEAYSQQLDCPRVPEGGAIVVSPLALERIDPQVVLLFGSPAQIMMALCGLQKEKYERFSFSFTGEGACADSLAACYLSRKPSVAIPCYGERAIGQVADDELVIAFPAEEVGRAVSGMRKLADGGLRYPIPFIGGSTDVGPMMSRVRTEASKVSPAAAPNK